MPRLDDRRTGAPGAGHQRLESRGVDIGGDNLALVAHRGGEREGFAARAGRDIQNPHSRLGAAEQRRDLRSFVLELEGAFRERGRGAELR